MGVSFLTETLILPWDVLVWEFVLFVLDILKTKCNLSIFGAMFDIFTVTSTSQYSLMFWSALGDSYQQMKRNPGDVSIE